MKPVLQLPISHDASGAQAAALCIATTHTQARYVLPPVLRELREHHPSLQLHLRQGSAEQIAALVGSEAVDLVIASGAHPLLESAGWLRIPCFRWQRVLVMRRDHPLARARVPTLAELAREPLVTYSFSIAGPSSLLRMFRVVGLEPQIALSAWDSDVLKTYVREGFGVGILADLAIDGEEDADLVIRNASHLFPPLVTWLGLPPGTQDPLAAQLLTLLAPQIDAPTARWLLAQRSQRAIDGRLADIVAPYLR